MSNVGPVIGREDQFEGLYMEKFRTLVRGHGEFVRYERDRAALDVGLHLTASTATNRRVSHTRIWFQLKGLQKQTLPLEDYQRATDVAIRVPLDHLKFWFASPEPIYLVVMWKPLTDSLPKTFASSSTADGVRIFSRRGPSLMVSRKSP